MYVTEVTARRVSGTFILRTQAVMPTRAMLVASSATDATRLARTYCPKFVGLGTSVQAARPAEAAVSPRTGVYTLHLRSESRRSRTFDAAPTTNAPRGPNTTAEKTSGR